MFLPKCRLLGQLQDIEDSHRCTLISSRASRWGPTAQIIPGGEAPLMSVVVTKDGKFILAGSQDMVLRRWNARTGALLVTSAAQPHGDQDWSGLHLLALSSDESRVVSASCEVMLRVWDANSLDVLSTFEQHTQPVHAMSTISENRVVSGDWAGTIHVWDLITGSIHTSIQLADSIHTFACSPDSQTLAYGGDYIVTLRDLRSGHKTRTLPMPWEKVRDDPYKWLPETPEDGAWMAITFSSDGAYVCCSDPHEGHIWRWLARTGDLLDIISGPINMDAMHYTLDRSTIILRSTIPPRAIRIYNIEQNVVTGSLRVGDTTITPLDAAFLAVGDSSNYLVTPCTDGCIRIWELGSVYQEPVPNGGHGGFPVNNLKFASEGELVISIAGGRNKSGLRFWNAYSGLDCTRCPWDMDDRVSETFELGDRYHFLTIDENHARIWDWSTAEIIRTWKRNPNHLGWFSPSAISPDNAYLAVIQTSQLCTPARCFAKPY
jgi:WD40 repeat protein